MGEQRVISEAQASRCLHPEAVGKRWGDPISLVRQTELQARLDAWNAQGTEHGDSKGPYEGLRLSGADVSWLVDQSGFERDGAPNLHLEGANLKGTHLEGANLSSAHLEGANLEKTYLVGSTFNGAHLEGSNLFGAFVEQAKFYRANMMGVQLDFASLERTTLTEAHLEYARLVNAHLEGADLEGTNLERANLDFAHLEGADLSNANLRSACFTEARLEGVNLEGAVLESADLTQSWLDRRTVLTDAVMDRMTKLGDIQRGGVGVVNLTRIGWERILTLGDEYGVGLRSPIRDHTSAVRAYRQLAAQLRAQGLNDVADRFSHRAQIRQRLAYLT